MTHLLGGESFFLTFWFRYIIFIAYLFIDSQISVGGILDSICVWISKLHVKDNTRPSQNVLNCLNGEDTFVADLLADAEAEFSVLEEACAIGAEP